MEDKRAVEMGEERWRSTQTYDDEHDDDGR